MGGRPLTLVSSTAVDIELGTVRVAERPDGCDEIRENQAWISNLQMLKSENVQKRARPCAITVDPDLKSCRNVAE